MSTILFDKIVFGPIHSRRLGVSLGMNLLPTDINCKPSVQPFITLLRGKEAGFPRFTELSKTLLVMVVP